MYAKICKNTLQYVRILVFVCLYLYARMYVYLYVCSYNMPSDKVSGPFYGNFGACVFFATPESAPLHFQLGGNDWCIISVIRSGLRCGASFLPARSRGQKHQFSQRFQRFPNNCGAPQATH